MSKWDLWSGKHRKEDADGRGEFSRKAQLWFALAIRERLSATDEEHPKPAASDEELDDLVKWFCNDAMLYVKWEVASEYRGKGYSAGAWTLEMDSINRDLNIGREEVRRARLRVADTEVIKSLDEWLEADRSDTLRYEGATGGVPQIEESLSSAMRYAAVMRRATWPRCCVVCGDSFKPERRKARRCPRCLRSDVRRRST